MNAPRTSRRGEDKEMVLGSNGAIKLLVVLLMLLSIAVTYSVTAASLGRKIHANSATNDVQDYRLDNIEKIMDEIREVNASTLLVNAKILAKLEAE